MRLSALLLVAVSAIAAEIPQGAHVMLRMENSITTRTAKDGDYVYLRTGSPISVAGNIILPVGSYVQGVVTNAKRSGRVKGRAELAIRLETITLPTGSVYKFSPKLASVDSGTATRKSSAKRTPSRKDRPTARTPRASRFSPAAAGRSEPSSIKARGEPGRHWSGSRRSRRSRDRSSHSRPGSRAAPGNRARRDLRSSRRSWR